MVEVIDDRIYFDGYVVAAFEQDVPPTVRDRFETLLEQAHAELQWCDECGRERL